MCIKWIYARIERQNVQGPGSSGVFRRVFRHRPGPRNPPGSPGWPSRPTDAFVMEHVPGSWPRQYSERRRSSFERSLEPGSFNKTSLSVSDWFQKNEGDLPQDYELLQYGIDAIAASRAGESESKCALDRTRTPQGLLDWLSSSEDLEEVSIVALDYTYSESDISCDHPDNCDMCKMKKDFNELKEQNRTTNNILTDMQNANLLREKMKSGSVRELREDQKGAFGWTEHSSCVTEPEGKDEDKGCDRIERADDWVYSDEELFPELLKARLVDDESKVIKLDPSSKILVREGSQTIVLEASKILGITDAKELRDESKIVEIENPNVTNVQNGEISTESDITMVHSVKNTKEFDLNNNGLRNVSNGICTRVGQVRRPFKTKIPLIVGSPIRQDVSKEVKNEDPANDAKVDRNAMVEVQDIASVAEVQDIASVAEVQDSASVAEVQDSASVAEVQDTSNVTKVEHKAKGVWAEEFIKVAKAEAIAKVVDNKGIDKAEGIGEAEGVGKVASNKNGTEAVENNLHIPRHVLSGEHNYAIKFPPILSPEEIIQQNLRMRTLLNPCSSPNNADILPQACKETLDESTEIEETRSETKDFKPVCTDPSFNHKISGALQGDVMVSRNFEVDAAFQKSQQLAISPGSNYDSLVLRTGNSTKVGQESVFTRKSKIPVKVESPIKQKRRKFKGAVQKVVDENRVPDGHSLLEDGSSRVREMAMRFEGQNN